MSKWNWAKFELIRAHGAGMELSSACKNMHGRFVKLVRMCPTLLADISSQSWWAKANIASLNYFARAHLIGPWGNTMESLLELDSLWGVVASIPVYLWKSPRYFIFYCSVHTLDISTSGGGQVVGTVARESMSLIIKWPISVQELKAQLLSFKKAT